MNLTLHETLAVEVLEARSAGAQALSKNLALSTKYEVQR